ncbi:tryptophan synthase alpha chain [Vallitalea longa]|uniref:tryptophan synthase n=1 Tax=Vallitalea longa TaxID=2936439 RepID=A0A9W5YB38_9FIRM|nr:tryptophan synthase subunit alpha [Vallitalea longa]GKX30222.1 tryptophan synthase alpha chain [Vallitalea longa]
MSVKIIGYLSFGYPTIEKSIERADIYIKAGCDFLEVDFPTDNAYLDSDFIGGRMKAAMEACDDFDKYFKGIETLKEKYPNTPIILLAYEHTIKAIGVEKFIKRCKELETYDLIMVGLENEDIKNQLIKEGIKISCWVPFDLPEENVTSALASNGFVYLQSKSGGKEKEGYETLDKCIKYLRERGIKNPIYCGVGVSTREDIVRIEKAGADAAFIGSALLKQETDEDIINYIQSLKSN